LILTKPEIYMNCFFRLRKWIFTSSISINWNLVFLPFIYSQLFIYCLFILNDGNDVTAIEHQVEKNHNPIEEFILYISVSRWLSDSIRGCEGKKEGRFVTRDC